MTVKKSKLGDVAEFINGVAFKPSDWGENGRPIIRIQNLTDSSKPFNRTFREVDEKYIVKNGDLLVSWSATLGVFIWDQDEDGLLNQHIFRVLPNSKQIDKGYLRHMLTDALIEMKRHLHGATMQHVNRGEFLSTSIPLPPLAEQKRIAAILDKADAVRRKLQQSLRLSDDFLRSVFLDMFGDPVTNPKGWKIGRMGDYSDQLTGYAFKSSEYVQAGEGVRLCRGANVLPGVIDWSDRADWPKDQCSLLDRFQLIQGDIVVAMDRPWISSGFKTARITEHDVPSLLVQRVARIRAKAPLSNNYLFSLLNQGSFARHCKPTETTIPHISPIELREFPVAIPSKTQLEKFDKIYLKLSHAKCAMQRKAHDSEHLFFSLQQRAFRGEL